MTTNRFHFTVTGKKRETNDTTSILLKATEGGVPYRSGQFITLVIDNLGPTELRRSYSMSSAPGVDNQLAITVKKIPNGAVSRYLVDTLQVGDKLTALAPAGRFTIEAQQAYPRDIFLIGGGSGITPLFSLAKYLLREELQSRVLLINANRDENSIIFRDQITAMANARPYQFQVLHFLSDPKASVKELLVSMAPASVRWGRLGNALIEDIVSRNISYRPEHARFFLCGPSGLLLKVENALGFMGFNGEQVQQEVFTIKTAFRPDPENYPKSEVQLNWNGTKYQFPVSPGQTLLEAAQQSGLDLPYSCRSGSCSTCTALCTNGKIEMFTQDGRLTSTHTNGLTYTCVGYPLTEQVDLEIS